jgi:hypothetical protein
LKREDWVLLGKRRIINILRSRLLASEKQLESKIAESGPTNQLCNPHILSSARLLLEEDNKVRHLLDPSGMPFYYHTDVYDPSIAAHAQRKELLFQLYAKYRRLVSVPELCGSALEKILWQAIPSNTFLTIGSQNSPTDQFGQIKLPGRLDIILISSNGPQFAALIEAKNIREWIYPTNHLLWKLIEKALAFRLSGHPTVPVLISRKIQSSTRNFFHKVGILGLDTHYQYFDESLKDDIVDIQHTDGLGFKDVRIIEPPLDYVLRFFNKTILEQGPAYAKQFDAVSPILERHVSFFADKNVSFKQRTQRWNALSQELRISSGYDDYDEEY